MGGSPVAKIITLQPALPLINDEASLAGKHPLVALLEADAAVALDDFSQLGDLDVKIEGATVAVSVVCLELWRW